MSGDVLELARVRLREFEEARAADRAVREPMSDTAWAGVELAAVMPEVVAEVERLHAQLGAWLEAGRIRPADASDLDGNPVWHWGDGYPVSAVGGQVEHSDGWLTPGEARGFAAALLSAAVEAGRQR